MTLEEKLRAGFASKEELAQIQAQVDQIAAESQADSAAFPAQYTIDPETGKIEEIGGGEVTLEAIEELLAELGLANPGDILTADASGNLAVLPVGFDDQVLTAASSLDLGLFWNGPVTPPEANGGEELAAALAKWVTVGTVVQSVPNDNKPEISQAYAPPPGTDLLVVFYYSMVGAARPGLPKPTFTGGAPDFGGDSGAMAATGRYSGYRVWKSPGAGTIAWAPEKNTDSIMFVALSIKNQGANPITVDGTDWQGHATAISLAQPHTEMTFPGIGLSLFARWGSKAFSLGRVGTRILKKENDAAGADGEHKLEVCVAGLEAGEQGDGYEVDGEGFDQAGAIGVCEQEVP